MEVLYIILILKDVLYGVKSLWFYILINEVYGLIYIIFERY